MSNDVGNRASYIYTQRSDSLDVTENEWIRGIKKRKKEAKKPPDWRQTKWAEEVRFNWVVNVCVCVCVCSSRCCCWCFCSRKYLRRSVSVQCIRHRLEIVSWCAKKKKRQEKTRRMCKRRDVNDGDKMSERQHKTGKIASDRSFSWNDLWVMRHMNIKAIKCKRQAYRRQHGGCVCVCVEWTAGW